MTTHYKHGGPRKGAGAKPSGKPWLQTVSGKFAPEEIQRLDASRKPGESRAACVRRLVLAALDHS